MRKRDIDCFEDILKSIITEEDEDVDVNFDYGFNVETVIDGGSTIYICRFDQYDYRIDAGVTKIKFVTLEEILLYTVIG